MKTKYSEIVDVEYVGRYENPISLNDILRKAVEEGLAPSEDDREKVMFLAIDVQQDFMDNGSLGVPGAIKDAERMTSFIYNYMDRISDIAVSIDTHLPQQIFHPCWWEDEKGNDPAPYTSITLADLDNGKWRPTSEPEWSRRYVERLEKDGKKTLCIWPYHCIHGTSGWAFENQFANMIYFHSVARKAVVSRFIKGQDPLSEMYGIIKPEYDSAGYVNAELLYALHKYDKVIIAGESKSHCVCESVRQILELLPRNMWSKVYILEDCMSSIHGFEDATEKAFSEFKAKYNINIVKTTDDIF